MCLFKFKAQGGFENSPVLSAQLCKYGSGVCTRSGEGPKSWRAGERNVLDEMCEALEWGLDFAFFCFCFLTNAFLL